MRTMILALAALLAPWSALANTQYAKVAIVAQAGGYYDYTTPWDAMSAVTTWCGDPGPDNHCLIKIMPGVYDHGAFSMQMKSYVDVEGSGRGVTKIKGSVEGDGGGVVRFLGYVSNCELRSLTVEHAGGVTNATAVLTYNSDASLRDVEVRVSGARERERAIFVMGSGSVVLDHVTAVVDGDPTQWLSAALSCSSSGPVTVMDSSLTVTASAAERYAWHLCPGKALRTTILAPGGVAVRSEAAMTLDLVQVQATATPGTAVSIHNPYGGAGTLRIDGSQLTGTSYAIINWGQYTTVQIGATRLDGPVFGTMTCASSYKGSYASTSTTCQ